MKRQATKHKKRALLRRAVSFMLAGAMILSIVGSASPKTAKAADPSVTAPENNARVNNGAWSNGTTDTPVPVIAGDQIEYSITAYAPSSALPMMMQGNNGDATDTTWWNQSTGTPQVQKSQVATITFVNLPINLKPNTAVDQFLALYNSVWAGKPILKAWDATETDPSLNPDLVDQRVVTWVTASAVAGHYDLFVGGQGGVWMSSSPVTSYLFNNFSDVASIDFSNFHTDRAVNMSWMFASVGSSLTTPPTLDLSHFATAQVTYMDYMFYQYAYNATTPPILDLTHFDTSQVINTNSMFYQYAYNSLTPPTLNLTHMDTSNVIYMSYMFAYYAYSATGPDPVTLDLTHFNTTKVTYMDFMFQSFAYSSIAPPVLDLTHFDTSQVISMNSMFYDYAFSATTPPILDLTHFDTSRVLYLSNMFYQYAYSATTPPTLDLSRFDVSNVTYMDFMFYQYAYSSTAPFTLDLRWWKIGAATGGTNMTNMFSGCRQLTVLRVDSGVFSNTTITGTSGIFTNGNASLAVTVNTTANRTWMLALSPAPPTVTAAGLPTGAPPAPLPVTLIPPLPVTNSAGSGASQTFIADAIPAGLSIDPSSITGTQSDTPSDNAITWQIIGQSVFWSVPDTMFPATVTVKAAVNLGLSTGTTFDNTASVGPTATNTTFHQLVIAATALHVQVRYHLMAADGKVIATDSLPGNWQPGDHVNPTLILDAHRPFGYGSGIAVGTKWTISANTSANTFDIYYPDTAPVIKVKRDVLYVRMPVTLTFADILRSAGVSISDAEEDIPLSRLQENGYGKIAWNSANYPSGDGYVITLQVNDTPGLTSDIQSIVIFVLAPGESVRPPSAGEKIPTEPAPAHTAWGLDTYGEWVIYTPLAASSQTTKSSELPATGDIISALAPVITLAVAFVLAVLALLQKRSFLSGPS